MQTFLSEPTVGESVEVIDNIRLNKQLLECRQILDAIASTPLGGRQKVDGKYVFAANHPVTNMYRGFEYFLFQYAQCCAVELKSRGIGWEKNYYHFVEVFHDNNFYDTGEPSWWTDPVVKDKIAFTHRASLYGKDPQHYGFYQVDQKMLNKFQPFFCLLPNFGS